MSVSFRSGIDKLQPAQAWLWRNRILANSVNIIDGRKGSGKSTYVRGLLGAWKRGKMPDGTPPHRKLRRIMWFSSEEDYDNTIGPALEIEGIPSSDVITIDRRQRLAIQSLNIVEHYAEISAEIMDKKIDAVVLDPYTELKPPGYSSKDDGATRDYLTLMLTMASATLSTWILMRHLRKAKATSALDEGAGSVQIAAACRSVTRVDWPDRDKPDRYYSVLACNLGEPVSPMSFRIVQSAAKIPVVKFGSMTSLTVEEIADLSDDQDKRDVLDEAKKLLQACLAEGKCNARDILKEAKDNAISESTLRTAKRQLKIIAKRVKDPVTGVVVWRWIMTEPKKD
jgi:hypothetical protein